MAHLRRSRALAWLALALAVPAAARAADPVGELEMLRRAIEEHRERVGAYEREERGLLETLEGIDRAAEALGDDAARARRDAHEAREQLAALDLRRRELEPRVARTRRALAARARALYKAGELGPVQAVFAAESLPDALGRVQSLRRLVEHDQALLLRFREESGALATTRSELAETTKRSAAAAERLEQRQRELAREQAGRREVLRRVSADRTRTREALSELEAAAQALEETLAHLSETRAEPTPRRPALLLVSRRSLAPPVDAPVSARFGRVVDPDFGTEILRKGIDFAAETGAPVHAVADGEVRFTGWFRGYGKIVILDHGADYFTVSGHLDAVDVEVGQAVTAGEVLGRVGETGSLTGPKLYFELRRGGEALDPGDWLRLPAGR